MSTSFAPNHSTAQLRARRPVDAGILDWYAASTRTREILRVKCPKIFLQNTKPQRPNIPPSINPHHPRKYTIVQTGTKKPHHLLLYLHIINVETSAVGKPTVLTLNKPLYTKQYN